jgi:hypothetical protein
MLIYTTRTCGDEAVDKILEKATRPYMLIYTTRTRGDEAVYVDIYNSNLR